MGDYTGRHRPLVSAFRERKRGPRATCIRFAAAVLMIGAVLASAGFLNRKMVEQTGGPLSPRPAESIQDDGLLNLAAVSPPPSAGPVGAPATGPATTPGRTSPPPTGGGVAMTKGGPAGAWNFEENKGVVAADSSGFQRSAMLCGGAAWGAGHDSPSGLRLAASFGDGCAYATGAMLRTDTGFTVSAWVNLDPGARESAALSQEGTTASGFYLMYDDSSRWCMRMPRSDSGQADFIEACGNGSAQAGRWTHLAGVYDSAARQVRLYVDGAKAGSAIHPGMMWRALGYFYMGRARYSGDEFYRWQGSIDEVRAFDYALNDQQVADLFGGKA
ncbi:MAG TPA: LamG domain-containing protein [Candidatus Limnocylindrales bacterium]|nr:LamG domain-containing protein [Candidatus Limnocylindrales bacterium]